MIGKRKSDAGDTETPKAPRDLLLIESSWLEIAIRPIRVRKDGALPLRFRFTNNDFHQLDDFCRRKTKRELLVQMYALWRAIGRRIPRGRRFPTLKEIMPMINATAETAKLMIARDRPGKPMAVQEIARELQNRSDR